jgi:hypothetical protein
MVWTAIPVYVLQATLEKTAKPTLMTVHQILARMEETALMVWTCLLAHVQPVTQDKNVRPTLTTVHQIPVRMVAHV